MKNLYTTLLAGAALLMAGGTQAQHATKGGLRHLDANSTVRPVVFQGGDFRGGTPPNDECTGAVNQNLSVGGSVTFSGDNTGATDSDSLGFPAVWETFTTTECTNLTLTYCGTNPAFGNAFLSIFIDCPFSDFIGAASFDVTTCADGNVTIFYESIPAGQYYYAVLNDPDNGAVGPYTVTVSASACASAPANDECAGATSLTTGTNCIGTFFTTEGATETLPAIECDGFTSPAANDVWFSFVATATSMTIAVTGYNEADAFIELFEGSCGALNSLDCQDETFPQAAGEQTSEQLIFTSLTVGTTYYVRVYDYGHASPDHGFEICVVEGEGTNIGIAEIGSEISVSIFPNPGTGVFSLQYLGESTTAVIEVFDATGRVVYSQQAQLNNGTVRTMDLSGLANGNYNVRLTANGERTEQRLVKN